MQIAILSVEKGNSLGLVLKLIRVKERAGEVW